MDITEFAKELYLDWATRMDMVEPQQQMIEVFSYGSDTKEVAIDRAKSRPKWHALTTIQQEVWLSIAKSILEKYERKPVLHLHYDDSEVE